jgi:hypothetical protein
MDFLVRRDDLHECRFDDLPAPEPGPGQVLMRLERFGLTSNNVTYAVMGDAMSYWRFFPAEEGWGRIPVWGFASVAASAHDDLAEGSRWYGYHPPSSHFLLTPEPDPGGAFTDVSEHRVELPAVYNRYVPAGEASDAEELQVLFRPLFGTSFLIDDFLEESEFFGAGTVVLSSASSKTAIGTAFLLSRREGIEVVGLTSATRVAWVEGLGVYDRVAAYEDVGALPRERSVYVDMSGDAPLRAAVHARLGDALAHDCVVGASHWDRLAVDAGPLAGPAPEFFFAPARFAKRREDWGAAGLEQRAAAAWRPFSEWAGGWLEVERGSGREDVERTYLALLEGRAAAAAGYVLTL